MTRAARTRLHRLACALHWASRDADTDTRILLRHVAERIDQIITDDLESPADRRGLTHVTTQED